MPEGPEIRRAADRIADVLVGEIVEDVHFAFEHLKAREAMFAGCRVSAVDTRGKALLTRFDNGWSIYSHNQLYGRWFTTRRGTLPDTGRSLRLALHTAARSALLYSASEIEVLDASGERDHAFLGKLGPDLFEKDLDAARIADRLADPIFRRRSLAALYLDQSFLAGLGNYLRSEILFLAGVAPESRAGDLNAAERQRLGEETLAVALRSYRTGGVTLDRATRQSLSGGKRRQRFWVFARAGQPCRRCGQRIVREARSGRRLYRCPGCQGPSD